MTPTPTAVPAPIVVPALNVVATPIVTETLATDDGDDQLVILDDNDIVTADPIAYVNKPTSMLEG